MLDNKRARSGSAGAGKAVSSFEFRDFERGSWQKAEGRREFLFQGKQFRVPRYEFREGRFPVPGFRFLKDRDQESEDSGQGSGAGGRKDSWKKADGRRRRKDSWQKAEGGQFFFRESSFEFRDMSFECRLSKMGSSGVGKHWASTPGGDSSGPRGRCGRTAVSS